MPVENGMPVKNGMPADTLPDARWRKSSASNPSGCCVELAEVPGRKVAVRNSRDKTGPALVYARAEIATFLRDVRDGAYDSVIADLSATGTGSPGHGISAQHRESYRKRPGEGRPRDGKVPHAPYGPMPGALRGVGLSRRENA